MREKTITGKSQKEKYKFLAVVVFFLISGVIYSRSFYGGSLEMGKEITVEQIGISKEMMHPAEDMQGKININSATATELESLSDIGSVRAADIIEYREENGNFSRIEDIMQVSGIGEKTFAEIKEWITVGE